MASALQFKVPYSAALFPPGTVQNSGMLTVSPSELAHALFVTGRAPADQLAYGRSSIWELIHRVSLIPAYLRVGAGNRMVRSRLATDLDRSEKVAVSYALGQAMTGVFCEQLLGVDHLLHVERYAHRYGVRFGSTGQRPDLIGRSRSGWVVAEAKGRSNGMESALAQKLWDQKRSISSIQGVAPWCALGCVASFPPKTRSMRVDAVDPEDEEPEAVELSIDEDLYVLAYYEPFAIAIDGGSSAETDGQITRVTFEGLGLTMGLDGAVLELVRAAREGSVVGLAERVEERLESTEREASAFRDGSEFETEWDAALTLADLDEVQ